MSRPAWENRMEKNRLLLYFDDDAGTHGAAAFTDSKAQLLLNGDGGDQFDVHIDVIAGHAHLDAFGQRDDAGHVGGTEVELGSVVVEDGYDGRLLPWSGRRPGP